MRGNLPLREELYNENLSYSFRSQVSAMRPLRPQLRGLCVLRGSKVFLTAQTANSAKSAKNAKKPGDDDIEMTSPVWTFLGPIG